MNLENPTQENMTYMLNEITAKLKMVNASVFENLTLEAIHYDSLLDIYSLIHRKNNISMREMQLFAEELSTIRK
ncbi:DUF1128 domain-containing protein [Paenilisteria rocourtiae]|uniref:Uncharacterized protein YfkK (UPF0435 family) n=1 Tax=Listeria rocourtiae TaxID=647910 RepID=A0A4R6ZI68_9LIST|nr:DUF1128 family protein [Listeria rocourtiae]EUJ44508.1 UPF0435 protein [Listeria rocourtiae FSL F6-920]MBC1435534.1 DUF1128 family protein [Listeria rocourtiae]MBC1604851.1 DUF1128 family protein [Listeria rocourtiae]TDR52007.1 uncharacterized protein YfkK (UPF0435 family) [Listeria rocourtiae]